MRWTNSLPTVIAVVLMLTTLAPSCARAIDDMENRRIEYLIASIETVPGAKFVRNGSEYDGKEAAAHLRMKYRRAGKRVQTAEDFITMCASQSYVSGEPYLIVLASGQKMPSKAFFLQKLKEFDQKLKQLPKPTGSP